MVCTRETGILAMASELRMCPPIWKSVRGSVVAMSSLVGGRMPNLRAGIVDFKRGYDRASRARTTHHEDTKANCTTVSVMGFGNEIRIALEEVLDRMDVMYHMPQRTFSSR